MTDFNPFEPTVLSRFVGKMIVVQKRDGSFVVGMLTTIGVDRLRLDGGDRMFLYYELTGLWSTQQVRG